MNFFQLDCRSGGTPFQLGRFTATLYKQSSSARRVLVPQHGKGAKVLNALRLCNCPYELAASYDSKTTPQFSSQNLKRSTRALATAKRAVWLCGRNFYLARLWASSRVPIFDSAAEAIHFFRTHIGGEQSRLCLPRAMFAAKTSRRFFGEGVLFIGVFLPARSMHAWVLENNTLADPWDDAWTNYKPVAALA